MAVEAPSPAAILSQIKDEKHHILLAATGSVATIKIPLIAALLSTHNPDTVSIRIILTSPSKHFLQGQSAEQPYYTSLLDIPCVDAVYSDEDEWVKPWVRGDKILHIELRRWAHVLVIAPLSANSLAKIVGGFCDDLLACVVRAWDPFAALDPAVQDSLAGGEGRGSQEERKKRLKKKRILVAIAMNTAMYTHPLTQKQVRVLEEEWGVRGPDDEEGPGWFEVLRPQEKTLACGDVGTGAMLAWEEIVRIVEERLGL